MMTAEQPSPRPLRLVQDVEAARVYANEEAEHIVLGAMMTLTVDRVEDIFDQLTAADFYKPHHITIYQAILGVIEDGDRANPIAVAQALAEAGELDRVGGIPYLHTLVAAVPVGAQGAYYARIVADWSARRRTLEACTRGAQAAMDLRKTVADVIEEAQAAIHAATTHNSPDTFVVCRDSYDRFHADVLDPDSDPKGLSTGLGSLDDLINGMEPGRLLIVGARPGVGKSVLLSGMCRAAAIHRKVPTGLWSMEMPEKEIMRRLAAAECDINLSALTRKTLTDADRQALADHAAAFRAAPLYIDVTPAIDLVTLRSRARRLQQRHGLGLILIDYLQLMTPSSRTENRATAVAEISKGLKALALELNVPIVAAAQLNRASEGRTDHRPQLSDLRESGGIEADADVVILLHREDVRDPEHVRAGEIDLILAKNRNAAQDTITCSAQLHKARIVDYGI